MITNHTFVSFCAKYLVGLQVLLFAGLFALVYDVSDIVTALVFITCAGLLLIITVFTAWAVKLILKRHRPSKQLFKPADKYAFPSKHAAGLAVLAMYMTFFTIPIGILAWIITILVCYGRVQANLHYISDTIGGLLLGILVAHFGMPYTLHIIDYFAAWFVR